MGARERGSVGERVCPGPLSLREEEGLENRVGDNR